MPGNRPPRTTRAGHLHATAQAVPALPVRHDGLAPAAPVPQSPLAVLRPPATLGDTACTLVVRALDRGRLFATSLTVALGWAPGTALEADVSRAHVLRLRPAPPTSGPVAGTHRAHTDGAGRIVVSTALRHFLGVDTDGEVVAWTAGDGVLLVAPAALIPLAIGAYAEAAQPRLAAVPARA